MVLFMASTDDAETSRKFAAANAASFPVLSDPDGAVAKRYGVLKLGLYAARETFYVDGEGKIAFIDRDVNPLTAGADVAARLAELGIARRPPP
jgi:peroxiredoxin Q/BCP